MPRLILFVRWSLAIAAVAIVLTYGTVAWLWQYRTPLESLPWAIAETLPDDEGSVSATWLGVTTLLFDDGETQILIDGYFTRASAVKIALLRNLKSDVATINYVMDEYRIDRLAAIVPVHSHLDHAMDVGRVANRSTALVIGSGSTSNIARGADVPVNQFQTLASGESRVFGKFTVTLIASRHVPVGPAAEGFPAGVIDEPLRQPARFWAWKGGVSHSILISHPAGTALVQGSAGFEPGALAERTADVVFLSVAGLAAQGRRYAEQYWDETVGATGATGVFAVHFDDFTLPFGRVELLPDIADEVLVAAEWLNSHARKSDIEIKRPPFGIPVILY